MKMYSAFNHIIEALLRAHQDPVESIGRRIAHRYGQSSLAQSLNQHAGVNFMLKRSNLHDKSSACTRWILHGRFNHLSM